MNFDEKTIHILKIIWKNIYFLTFNSWKFHSLLKQIILYLLKSCGKIHQIFSKANRCFHFFKQINNSCHVCIKATKAVPPYSRAKIVRKGSGSANNSDFAVDSELDRFAKYSLSKAKIGSILRNSCYYFQLIVIKQK
jgi:hypothetical protein